MSRHETHESCSLVGGSLRVTSVSRRPRVTRSTRSTRHGHPSAHVHDARPSAAAGSIPGRAVPVRRPHERPDIDGSRRPAPHRSRSRRAASRRGRPACAPTTRGCPGHPSGCRRHVRSELSGQRPTRVDGDAAWWAAAATRSVELESTLEPPPGPRVVYARAPRPHGGRCDRSGDAAARIGRPATRSTVDFAWSHG